VSFPIITITAPGIEAYDLTEHRAMIRRSKATRGCEARLTIRPDARTIGLLDLISRFKRITAYGVETAAATPMIAVLHEALTPQLELF
jgi:hypothetical protein